MLTISPETFSRMAAVDLDRFVNKLALFVKQNVPGMADEPMDALRPQILALKKDAAGYDMKSEQAVAAYVVTAAFLGVDFPSKFKGARHILFAKESEARKAELLSAFTVTLFDALQSRDGRPRR